MRFQSAASSRSEYRLPWPGGEDSSVTTARAARSTRAPSARKPPTVNTTRPVVFSRFSPISCVGFSTRYSTYPSRSNPSQAQLRSAATPSGSAAVASRLRSARRIASFASRHRSSRAIQGWNSARRRSIEAFL